MSIWCHGDPSRIEGGMVCWTLPPGQTGSASTGVSLAPSLPKKECVYIRLRFCNNPTLRGTCQRVGYDAVAVKAVSRSGTRGTGQDRIGQGKVRAARVAWPAWLTREPGRINKK